MTRKKDRCTYYDGCPNPIENVKHQCCIACKAYDVYHKEKSVRETNEYFERVDKAAARADQLKAIRRPRIVKKRAVG